MNTLNNTIYINGNMLTKEKIYINRHDKCDKLDIPIKYSSDNAYEMLFFMLVNENKNKELEYETILKFYNGNYKYAVLSIEINNIKNELKDFDISFK